MAKASKAKVMIVASQKTEAEKIRETIQKSGYSVISVSSSGKAALAELEKLSKSRKPSFFEQNKPEIVLMDVHLPRKTEEIKAAGQIRSRYDIPIVYLSTSADKKTIKPAKSFKPYEYVCKPFTEKDLSSAIELARSRHAGEKILKEEKLRLRVFMDSATDHFMLFDSELNLIEVNKACLERWGMSREDVIGKNILDITPGIHRTERYKKYLEVLRTGKPYFAEEIRGHPKFGDRFINAKVFKVGDGLGIVVTDITERKKAKEALGESEKRYRLLVESMNEGLVMLDHKGMVTYINDRFPEVLGANRDEIIGHSVMEFVKPTDQKVLKQQMRRRSKGQRGTYEIELQKKDGEKIIVFVSGRPIFDEKGNFKGSIAVLTDITNIRLAEQELNKSREQLRNLSLYLQSIREEERKLLSREIHDELGQLLTALKMDLSWLSKRISKREGNQELLLEKARSMSELLNKTMKSVQKISSELRPGLLDDLGLLAAMEWQAQEFENRTKIKCEVSLDSEEIKLDPELSISIFRIFQEALTNVVRHAHATKVKVRLSEKNGKLTMKVKDNGRGITEEEIYSPDSLGLVGMRERISPWEGQIKIMGTKNRGTTLSVTLPLKMSAGSKRAKSIPKQKPGS